MNTVLVFTPLLFLMIEAEGKEEKQKVFVFYSREFFFFFLGIIWWVEGKCLR
jgi:hypothetical protein